MTSPSLHPLIDASTHISPPSGISSGDSRSLHRLFQPLAVTLYKAGLAGIDERQREVQLVLEVAFSSSSSTTTTSGGRPQRCFTVEAYGFKTHFPPAAHAADAALLKKWAGQLAPAAAGEEEREGSGSTRSGDLRVAAPRHVLGLRISVPHPHLVPACAPTPLEIKLSVS